MKGKVIAQWFIYGDGFPESTVDDDSLDIVTQSPLFSSILVGGFMNSQTQKVTTVSSPVDPMATLLLAHMCATEFSVKLLRSLVKVSIRFCYL
jgi:hypothetical protein